MNKSDLIEELAERLGLKKVFIKEVVDGVFDVITDQIKAGERVVVTGVGAFLPWDQSKRVGRNPKTGKEAVIKARRSIKFKPSYPTLNKIND